MIWDLVLAGGTVVDGTGAPPFAGDVAVKDGKIGMVSLPGEKIESKQTIDVTGKVVAPGFIDIHSHADWVLPLPDHARILTPFVEQGITTVVGGNCGFSPAPLKKNATYMPLIIENTHFLCDRPLDYGWWSFGSFLTRLKEQGLLMNLAMLTGYGTLRYSVMGNNFGYPCRESMGEMKDLIRRSFDEGSLGISLGLGYEPGLFTSEKELREVAELTQEYGLLLTVHLKALSRLSGAYPLWPPGTNHALRALSEMLRLAEETGVKLQISHLLFVGKRSWSGGFKALAMIDTAREKGLDIGFDSFPYYCGNTTIYVVYPAWFRQNINKNFNNPLARLRLWLEVRILANQLGFDLGDIQLLWGGHPQLERLNGLFFGEIARHFQTSLFDAYLKVSEMSRGRALCLLYKYSGEDEYHELYEQILAHPANIFVTDAILTSRGKQNPAGFGAFPRVLAEFCKEKKLLSLSQAVAKMTGLAAARIGLKERGLIKKGYHADITVFDYERIKDKTSIHALEERPEGIELVFINGINIVKNGRVLPSTLPGWVLKRT